MTQETASSDNSWYEFIDGVGTIRFNQETGEIMLFGGFSLTFHGDVVLLDGSPWTLVSPRGSSNWREWTSSGLLVMGLEQRALLFRHVGKRVRYVEKTSWQNGVFTHHIKIIPLD